MRVLLRLGDVQLGDMMLGQHLGERLVHVLLAEHGRSIQIRSIPGHGGDVGSCLDELLRELTRAVRPEVEEDRAVTRWIEPRTLADDDWLDELIRDPSLVTTPHRLDRILRVLPRAVDDRVERELRTLPALVAVHRVVATGNGRDAIDGQLGEVAHGRMRGDVASIRERVDPRLLRRECEQRLDVVHVRVHTAVRDEAEQMCAVASFECRLVYQGSRWNRATAIQVHTVLPLATLPIPVTFGYELRDIPCALISNYRCNDCAFRSGTLGNILDKAN